jgi:predicted secreted hydrolase
MARADVRRQPLLRVAALGAVSALLLGCTNGGVLRAAVPTTVPTAIPTPSTTPADDPQALVFPRDEGPHHRLTEWWYYTGHLQSDKGDGLGDGLGHDIGFELVVFRAERGAFPVAWASHLAVTDSAGGTFRYDQRSEYGPQVDHSPPGEGFDLTIRPPEETGLLPGPGGSAAPSQAAPTQPGASAQPGAAGGSPVLPPVAWTIQGAGGHDHLSAAGSGGEIDLDLTTDRPPVLHDDDGWVDLGPAGGTYYYSRTRMDIVGTFAPPGGSPIPVHGVAWFDHQWGDFIAVGAGGWDWFSVQLDDGRDLTISLVHGPGGVEVLDYGTLVAADGSARHLGRADFRISVLGRWLSPHSGGDYPAGWRIELPAENLTVELTPTLADQELDTKATTGVTYWEGEVTAAGTGRDGVPVAGRGYVELTGYAK